MQTSINSIKVIAVTPAHRLAPEIAIAACRAQAVGILDLGLGAEATARRAALSALARGAQARGGWGVRWNHAGRELAALAELVRLSDDPAAPLQLPLLVLAGVRDDQLDAARVVAAGVARAVLLEVCDLDGALAAARAGYDGVILKGHEAGGRVGALSSFVLLQECAGKLDLPYWIQGGIGIHTAAAAALAGATGVVLCEQLWLAAEGPFDAAASRRVWSHLDGSETVLAGAGAERHRLFARSGRARLREVELAQAAGESCWSLLSAHLSAPDDGLIALGQEIAFAAPLAQR
jgi:NAD(P)H-dependent flavin oxidoreductase YrpB (nitropropane dioxygenase family)